MNSLDSSKTESTAGFEENPTNYNPIKAQRYISAEDFNTASLLAKGKSGLKSVNKINLIRKRLAINIMWLKKFFQYY